MWTVVYMAMDQETALRVEDAISSEGILVKTREIMSKRHDHCIEVIVPESEAQEAQNIILEKNL